MPVRSEAVMGTVVTIQVARSGASVDSALDRAFGWFHEIENRCTRFDPRSELMQLCSTCRVPTSASPILFEAVQFALLVAEESEGAFDPTVGHTMQQRGFDREHRTGETIHTSIASHSDISYRDIQVDPKRNTIALLRPLTLDLGGVAKGLAVDAAAKELSEHKDFAIDAGGDLYLGGLNPQGQKWNAGIRDPRLEGGLIATRQVSNQAVCTSGDYERPGHLLDPRTRTPVQGVLSATVIAPNTMLADALATAAYVLGPEEGVAFLRRMGVEGMVVSTDGVCHEA